MSAAGIDAQTHGEGPIWDESWMAWYRPFVRLISAHVADVANHVCKATGTAPSQNIFRASDS